MSWTRPQAAGSSSVRFCPGLVAGASLRSLRRSAAPKRSARSCAMDGTRKASPSACRGRRAAPPSSRSRPQQMIRLQTPGTPCSRCCAGPPPRMSTASTQWIRSWLCGAAASKNARPRRRPSKGRKPSWPSWTRRKPGSRATADRNSQKPYAPTRISSAVSRSKLRTRTRSGNAPSRRQQLGSTNLPRLGNLKRKPLAASTTTIGRHR